jgi:tetratricopeptide (TPR) repeat protein
MHRFCFAILFLFTVCTIHAESQGWSDQLNQARSKFESRQQSECIPVLENLINSIEKESQQRTLTKEEQSIIEKSYDLLGQAQFNENQQAKARLAFRKLIELNPDYKMNEDLVSQKIIKLFDAVKRETPRIVKTQPEEQKPAPNLKSEKVIVDEINKSGGRSGDLLRQAYALMSAGNYEEAEKKYSEALDVARQQGRKADQANALLNLGFLFSSSGREAQAVPYWEESLTLTREIGDGSREALALYNLAIAAYNRGDLKKADELYEQSVQVSKRLGEEPRKKLW